MGSLLHFLETELSNEWIEGFEDLVMLAKAVVAMVIEWQEFNEKTHRFFVFLAQELKQGRHEKEMLTLFIAFL